MAPLSRFLAIVPSSTRSYSVFTKSGGGGRFFNSAKPPVANTVKATTSKPELSPSPTAAPEGSQDESATQASSASASETPLGTPSFSLAPFTPQHLVPFEPRTLVHPSITPQDLKLHQFFSLDRPLLQVSEHVGSLFESPPEAALSSFPHPPPAPTPSSILSSLDAQNAFYEGHELSPEADADTARQLARAMVMSNVASTVAWEEALKKLGLDLSATREGPNEADLENYGIYLDSTKRKRRSKMKKHKLKKRRRALRASRQRGG
ncbi:hypothetical protein PUNSTDRAFT_53548 [Punctularia strigosozonata HHB-11173 SS5]|uniref:uncharacterized protein n=1 Tax=Punctularia strigosozonata (strain HHB-11173) TaxID=741275 RepID=UPI0004417844|nr:uncharacterized protein PUNSTDRAFT_53548 [Punctularia strigosozonata HHB-11173 SS5]EIN07169.1 hypothetical protein PUNSTDRAFT_53548 [Punctularia strigosozonata HHB-11173 SS5]